MLRTSTLLRYTAVVALALATGCAGGQKNGEPGAALAAAEQRIDELESELARAEAHVEVLESAQTDADGATPAPMFSDAGLTEQLRARMPRPAAPEYFDPGPTAWREAPIPSGFDEASARGYETAGQLATAVAGSMTASLLGIDLWEVTTRVLVADDRRTASAAILLWGLKDDAGEGDDLRLELRSGDRGWYAEAAERRSWCSRGVTADQRCR